jgi:SAM-dependent methyltransferase
MEDPTLFDRRAEAYERGRPPYPAALFERLRELELMQPRLRVLDIGAGTGEASAEFVAAGSTVTAIEPGAALARRIATKWPKLTVLRARFEDAALPPEGFDVAVCATALHWLDLDSALPKLHDALTSDGHFAAWWTVFGDPAVQTPFRDKVAAITARRPPSARTHPEAIDTAYWIRMLTAGGYFTPVLTERLSWSIDVTAGQVNDLFSTFTGWSEDEVDEASAFVNSLGGIVTEHYVTALYVCRPTGRW